MSPLAVIVVPVQEMTCVFVAEATSVCKLVASAKRQVPAVVRLIVISYHVTLSVIVCAAAPLSKSVDVPAFNVNVPAILMPVPDTTSVYVCIAIVPVYPLVTTIAPQVEFFPMVAFVEPLLKSSESPADNVSPLDTVPVQFAVSENTLSFEPSHVIRFNAPKDWTQNKNISNSFFIFTSMKVEA
jgi:hypothetical protein